MEQTHRYTRYITVHGKRDRGGRNRFQIRYYYGVPMHFNRFQKIVLQNTGYKEIKNEENVQRRIIYE